MGATKIIDESKDYAIVVVFANEAQSILDITTKSNIKCYEWSLKRRLANLDAKYKPTNKIVKFVKSVTNDFTNIKVSTLKILPNLAYSDAKLELENASQKTGIPTSDKLLHETNDALNLIKSKLA